MTTLDQLEGTLRGAVEALPDGLRRHVERVETEARGLASKHGVDEQRICLAALGHDLVRHLSDKELLAMASRYGLTPDAVELAAPILVHGPVAAAILSRDYHCGDADILAGIDCHTTARAGMTPVEQVLFVADKVEPRKLEREAELAEVRDLAQDDLSAAVLRYLDLRLVQTVQEGRMMHPRTLEARNELISARL